MWYYTIFNRFSHIIPFVLDLISLNFYTILTMKKRIHQKLHDLLQSYTSDSYVKKIVLNKNIERQPRQCYTQTQAQVMPPRAHTGVCVFWSMGKSIEPRIEQCIAVLGQMLLKIQGW